MFTWTAYYAPPGAPQDRVEQLRTELARILKLPDVTERFTSQGAIVRETMTQAQVAAFISADITGLRKFIQEAGIQAE